MTRIFTRSKEKTTNKINNRELGRKLGTKVGSTGKYGACPLWDLLLKPEGQMFFQFEVEKSTVSNDL